MSSTPPTRGLIIERVRANFISSWPTMAKKGKGSVISSPTSSVGMIVAL
jgi:hypothetical protein